MCVQLHAIQVNKNEIATLFELIQFNILKIMQKQVQNLLSFLSVAMCALVLSACSGTMREIRDCKQGDWVMIGQKDGEAGLMAKFEDRRDFCAHYDEEKIKKESASLYQTGWIAGNAQFWNRMGVADGRAPRPQTFYAQQLNNEKVLKNRTPANPAAYEAGWKVGNADYWFGIGDQDGSAAKNADTEKDRAQSSGEISFNMDAYRQGWSRGNKAYWTRLGFEDAHNGVSDKQFIEHQKRAQQSKLFVRENAYRQAWEQEIVEYWKRLAWSDATSGWDVYMRRVDAKKRDLKFSEVEYQAMWEKRLQQYWTDAGHDDGFGQPNRFEERNANARNDKLFVLARSKDDYMQAWYAENARYCSPQNAFEFGRRSAYFALNVCNPNVQGRAQHGYVSGERYENVMRERVRVERDLSSTIARRNDNDDKLRRLEKEIKRDQDNKDRPRNEETAKIDKKREQDRAELSRYIRDLNHKIDDLEMWRHRHTEQLEQIMRSL